MKKDILIKSVSALCAVVIITFSACQKDDPIPTVKEYIGSAECKTCHEAKYTSFMNTGHPYKLNEVNGAAPTYPYSSVPNVPTGYSWSDISYVIGGYNWKARFIDQNGYIITGDAVQYNLANQGWVGYHSDEAPGTKPYDCGKCHTTGWKHIDDGGIAQNGMAGMYGQFSEAGIQCEACHGEGNIHAFTEAANDINIDETSELCGSCHYRNADHSIAASGGFIKHHEQYDEMKSSPHFATLTCGTCHDTHNSVLHGQTDGLIAACTDCHSSITTNTSHHGADCITCHLPLASKSAINTDGNAHLGDVKTHIFEINTAADGNMFNADSTVANPNKTGVTLNFVCYRCHKDDAGVGGTASTKTMIALSNKATGFHTAPK